MMDRELIKKAVKECKKEAGLDFAYSSGLGDCMSCTNSILADKFGENAKGLWVKWFRVGMNASKWGDYKTKYICHSLTKKQGDKVVEILSRYFTVEWSGESHDCIALTAKAEAAA